jgi:hypothetical protein
MARHLRATVVVLWISTLASTPFSASAAPCCRFTNFYLFPSGPKFYQCCSGAPDLVFQQLVSTPSAADPEALRSKVTLNEKSTYIVRKGLEGSCVNLSELTPFEKFVRTQANLHCVDVAIYDHFPCSCETRCSDVTWRCDCPGVPLGELPEIKPQDSQRSRPEFVGTICIPCNQQSTCSGSPPLPSGPPS